jgi:hypothetical protein
VDTDKPDGEIIVTADASGRVNVLLNMPTKEALLPDAPWWAEESLAHFSAAP